MSMENRHSPEMLPGEYEFELALGGLKAKFARAVEEQKESGNFRLFVTDEVEGAGLTGQVGRIRLADRRFVYDLQIAAQKPGAVIDVALPLAIADNSDPVLLADSPFSTDVREQFVLYDRETEEPIIVDALNMKEQVLDHDPRFVGKAFDFIPIALRKTIE